jgi:hypothetical protein
VDAPARGDSSGGCRERASRPVYGTDNVYRYVGAASRTSGSQNAAATFALAAGNTNPQGIADPPAQVMALTPAAAPRAPNQPPVAAVRAAPSVEPLAVAGVPALARRDAAFTPLPGEALQGLGEPYAALLAGGALTPRPDSPTPATGSSGTTAGASGRQKLLDISTPLTPESSRDVRSEHSALGLADGPSAHEEGAASAAATDSFFAGLVEDE